MRRTVHSVCALDCPDTCSILVDIDDSGRALRLRGNPDHPITRGFLCGKVARYLEHEYAPDRLLYPLRRTGAKGEGRFERISWDVALDEIAARLSQASAEAGSESILPYSYAGNMGVLNYGGMDRRFFHRLGASRLDRTICSTAGMAGTNDALGHRYAIEPEQFCHAKLIIAWGANILGTNVHLWPFIVEARRNGAKFYTIDPYQNRTGRAADRHYAIQPGTDGALALAMMHVIVRDGLEDQAYIERHTLGFAELKERVSEWTPDRAAQLTGIPATEIVDLAREYATTRPAAIRLNYGVQRSEHGAMAVRLISLLPAITGAWRDTGGGVQLSTSYAFQFNAKAVEMPELQLHSPLGRDARIINMTELGAALTTVKDPLIRALVVYNSNPAAIAPDQNAVRRGLLREDLFTVVIEQLQTDTADFADIVLPATTFLENTDLHKPYGHYYLQLSRPALPPPGEARSNQDIFRALAARMGFTEPCLRDTDDDMIRTALSSGHPFLNGITLEALDQRHSIRLNLPDPFLPFAEGGFGTPSGKCEFRAESLGYKPPIESRHGDASLRSRFPLELISPKGDNNVNSTFSSRPENADLQGSLTLHPTDAAARGIAPNDTVRLFNGRGECELTARVEYTVGEGVVCARSTRWLRLAPDRRGINMLTSQRLTDKGGGPTFYSCLVQVEKIA